MTYNVFSGTLNGYWTTRGLPTRGLDDSRTGQLVRNATATSAFPDTRIRRRQRRQVPRSDSGRFCTVGNGRLGIPADGERGRRVPPHLGSQCCTTTTR